MIQPNEIVAFLQNPWFPPATDPRHVKMYSDDVVFRRRVFASSMSGGRILRAFGEEWYGKIWWDNVSPEAATHSRGLTQPQITHIDNVLHQQKPRLVITLGKQAEMALGKWSDAHRMLFSMMDTKQIDPQPYFYHFPFHHPNKMGSTQAEMDLFAEVVKDYCEHADTPQFQQLFMGRFTKGDE